MNTPCTTSINCRQPPTAYQSIHTPGARRAASQCAPRRSLSPPSSLPPTPEPIVPAPSTKASILAPNTSAAGPGLPPTSAAARGPAHAARATTAVVRRERRVLERDMDRTAALLPPTAATGVCLVADQGVPATEILTAAYRAPNPTRVSDTVIKYPTYTQSGSSSTAICNTTTTTVNNDTSTTNHGVKLSNRSIVGIVIGGIALILALFFSWSVVKRYKLNKAAGTPRFDLPPIIEPPENRPMYVSTGMAYYDSPHGARPEMGNVGSSRYSNSNLASSGYAEGGAPGTATPNGLAQSQAESQQTQTQSPVPASAVPVGPMSQPPLPPYGSPPPPAQYRELHAQAALPGELDSRSAAAGLKRRPVEQGMEGRQELEGGGGQRGDVRHSVDEEEGDDGDEDVTELTAKSTFIARPSVS
ncbi:hypothetical protein V499_02821 [Pseudogymnoascus sp. VKM F-103]|nr:hypothetical protein V499_02821 [Pseudogymnoascus sp. VKM F-103]